MNLDNSSHCDYAAEHYSALNYQRIGLHRYDNSGVGGGIGFDQYTRMYHTDAHTIRTFVVEHIVPFILAVF
jgi:hypothetical protein